MRSSGTRERVCIIGGGVTGALLAARLAERGFAVTLLEKASIGNGSSSRSNACIRAQFGVPETVLGLMYSTAWYAHMHEHLHTPPESRQVVLKQNGYLFLYERPAHAERDGGSGTQATEVWEKAKGRAAMQQGLGLPVEVLAPSEVAARWPVEEDTLIGATWCPTDGFLSPHIIYGEGVRRARELGADVRTGCEVLGARGDGGRINALDTTTDEVATDWVINATNAWAPLVSARLGGMPLPIAPLKRYLYYLRVTAPVPGVGAINDLPMTIYGLGPGRGAFSRPDGPNLIVGWSHEATPELAFADEDQDRVEPGFSHAQGIENFGYRALEQVATFAPDLAECGGLAATTSGYYAMTPDASPLIGPDAQRENLLHAAGFSGHGVMHAPVTALLIEALLTGAHDDGRVALPVMSDARGQPHHIALAAFDPRRAFDPARTEEVVL